MCVSPLCSNSWKYESYYACLQILGVGLVELFWVPGLSPNSLQIIHTKFLYVGFVSNLWSRFGKHADSLLSRGERRSHAFGVSDQADGLGLRACSCILILWLSRWIRVLVFACQQEEICVLLYWCWICILEIGTAFISENFLYSNENYRRFFTELGWVCFQSKSNPSPTHPQLGP